MANERVICIPLQAITTTFPEELLCQLIEQHTTLLHFLVFCKADQSLCEQLFSIKLFYISDE